MASYRFASRPSQGEAIAFEQGALKVPANPVIPFVEGDGIGIDVTPAMIRVVNAAVEKAYGKRRRIAWMEVYSGEKANKLYGQWFPDEALHALREYVVKPLAV